LAIVQRAVEAHRGLVLVESGPGSGTTFTIFLPAKMVAEDAA
jgi:signal transduction histidine kinase